MIMVTGASGQLGRAVVDNLLDRVPAEQIAVSVRDTGKLADLRQRGVRVRHGDFGDPKTLDTAFEGASTVLIVSVNKLGDEAVRNHRDAIAAATAAGAKRLFYTSHRGMNPASAFPPCVNHAATEDVLKESGTAFTALRNGFYASTVPMLLRQALATGELRVPEDGAVAWTAHADLAEAAASLLIDGGFDEATPPLTGPAAVAMHEVAAIASDITGRTIRRVVVSDDEYRETLLAAGVPAARADMLVGMFTASRHGDFGPAGPALATVLGRPATSIEDYLREALPAAG
ncbi:NAD(P)H-binding protein [Amycolatopsis minnesotensis]|uniref:NAD(P)H-binding protein n=1 Tax=Amycolatopsis minnesotensis TaxID=337894 RepID=A0ABP5CM10_9PSEU